MEAASSIPKEKNLDIVHSGPKRSAPGRGQIDEEELTNIEEGNSRARILWRYVHRQHHVTPPSKHLGMSLPDSSAQLAVSDDKKIDAAMLVLRVVLIEKDIKPRDIMTRKAFENAITVVLHFGGQPMPCSTCWRWHMPPMWNFPWMTLRRLENVPVLIDLKPSGKYNMSHFVRIADYARFSKTLWKRVSYMGTV